MKKNIILIMFITIFTKLLGFGREIALTYFYGASAVSDVYLIAQTIPSTIFAFVGSGLATTFIPIYNKVREEKGDNEAKKFSANIINVVLMISVIIIIAVLLFTPQVVNLFASGFSGETMNLAVSFTRISIFGIIFTGLIYILNAYLQLNDRFIVPALISLPMNIIIIFSFYVASSYNDIILAYGLIISVLIQVLFLVPSLIKNRFKYKFIFDIKDVYLREMLILSIPVIIGTSVNQLNTLVDRNIASNIAVGGISALNYANRLNIFIHGIFVAPIITVIYPNFSKKVIDQDSIGLQKIINNSIVYISIFVMPATVGAMVLARPIIDLLFLRGEFTVTAANLTSVSLFYYSIGMLPFALRDVFSRVFYAYNDTKTPTTNAMVGVSINIIFNIILSRYLGIGGLALATSLSGMITAFLLISSLKKKLVHFGLRNTVIKIGKILLASLIMGLITFITFSSLKTFQSSNVALFISIIFGGFVYAIFIIILKIDEVGTIISLVIKKIKGIRNNK